MGVWVNILEFAGMLFIYLKATSKESAPEPSVYNYFRLKIDPSGPQKKCISGDFQLLKLPR